MQILRRHVLAVAIAAVALAGAGVAMATALAGPRSAASHTNPALRTYRFCPRRDRHPVSSTTVGAGAALVPAGAQQVLLCRYSGFEGYPNPVGPGSFRLIDHRLAAARTTVDRLASELDALKPAHGAQACPSDTGTAIIAFFRYGSPAKADDPVTIHLGGCSIVTNGHLNREAGFTLIRQLKALTRPPSERSVPYQLYTHCGIDWAKIHGTFWKAAHRLSDGQGNPPAGWGNPSQNGTLTFTSATTAVFKSAAGNVTFHRTARTQPTLTCS